MGFRFRGTLEDFKKKIKFELFSEHHQSVNQNHFEM